MMDTNLSKLLGIPQGQKKCECGKWHDNEIPFCEECCEEMEDRANEERRRERREARYDESRGH